VDGCCRLFWGDMRIPSTAVPLSTGISMRLWRSIPSAQQRSLDTSTENSAMIEFGLAVRRSPVCVET